LCSSFLEFTGIIFTKQLMPRQELGLCKTTEVAASVASMDATALAEGSEWPE